MSQAEVSSCCSTALRGHDCILHEFSGTVFTKLVFHVIWCGNILKTPMGHISGVAEPFFLKISQM